MSINNKSPSPLRRVKGIYWNDVNCHTLCIMQKASEQKYEGVTDIRQRRLGRITSINSAFCTKNEAVTTALY